MKNMTLADAWKYLEKGSRIRRPRWSDGEYFRLDLEHRKFINDQGADISLSLLVELAMFTDYEVCPTPILDNDNSEIEAIDKLLRGYFTNPLEFSTLQKVEKLEKAYLKIKVLGSSIVDINVEDME